MEYKAASVEIRILDSEGKPVEPPIVLELATNYTIQAVVTNRTTTTGGHPWEASFEVGFGISIDGIDIAPYTVYPPREFAPDQSQHYTETFYVPREWAGLAGGVILKVFHPFGKALASAHKPFKIGSEISPEAVYQPSVSEVEGRIDTIYISPEPGPAEVTMGGVSSKPPPPPPAPPPPKKVEHGPPVLGIDATSKPEPETEFGGEDVVDGRLG